MVSIQRNTSKDYPCTVCGTLGNIVREDDKNPRLKCLNELCGFMYNGQDSLAMVAAGKIPEGPPDIPEEPPYEQQPTLEASYGTVEVEERLPLIVSLPRTPTHVLLSKDRKYFDFVTKRTLRQEVLKWTAGGRKFDLFELILKKVDAKIDIE